MLLDIDKITLEMVRGDTFALPLPLNMGTREEFIPYYLNCNDCLYIGIMKPGQPFEHAEIRCMIDCNGIKDDFGNPLFYLMPEDTERLMPGKYYLSIKYSSGKNVTTLVDHKMFFITGSNPCC